SGNALRKERHVRKPSNKNHRRVDRQVSYQLSAVSYQLGSEDAFSYAGFSRVEDLAKISSPDAGRLSGDPIVSERRVVRTDQSDPAGQCFGSRQHRGRLWPQWRFGIRPLLTDRNGFGL